MRRIVAWNVMTLDGYFEGKSPWDLSFHNLVWGEELEAFSLAQGEELGTLLFGRKTYEGMASYWTQETGAIADMMNNSEKAVASRTLEQVTWNNSRLLEGDLVAAVERLKREPGKDIFVFGSADLLDTLLANGLVDEYRLCIAPVLLGAGNRLFKPGRELAMKLTQTAPLKNGGVILRYLPQAAA
ncbi:riboflavin biosynthesis protein RibD [Aminobacter sp. DSM 101952]|uniref:dihydrofolate reductase family protein n=1 Tax=Aminobacter sp. DSM 101952 TaxID=2735891 RepID=UPI0006F7869F|nr:dihydrofolate reductase family protein [Aminobacter sp. DSM 101952]KQU65612.1 riboflavin biosynthesis protein RibD [Aminobacter sp. DSM 101952]